MKDVYFIGRLNRDIFKAVTEDIVTDEVIITEVQLEHIKERHPNDYMKHLYFMRTVVENPDYILEANKPNSAVLLKTVTENGKNYKLILRFKTPNDPKEYKNSIITFLSIDEKDWKRLLRNKKILYKRE